ncbi:MAG: hypothetical protein AB8G05_23380 [Oligoflexales bacterium]
MTKIKMVSLGLHFLLLLSIGCNKPAQYTKSIKRVDELSCTTPEFQGFRTTFKLAELPPNVEMRSDGLPLLESNKDAPVALFLDFDGGTYYGYDDVYGPADLDGDESSFNSNEATRIYNAYMHVVKAFAPFNVNVTTVESVARASQQWAWLIISDDYSKTGGKGKISIFDRSKYRNGRPREATALAGAQAILRPRSYEEGYLLIHELGHNLGLEHGGLFKGKKFLEYSDLPADERQDFDIYDAKMEGYIKLADIDDDSIDKDYVGTYLGGRIYENGPWTFRWGLQITEDNYLQDPIKIISDITGFAEKAVNPDPDPDDMDQNQPDDMDQNQPDDMDQNEPDDMDQNEPDDMDQNEPDDMDQNEPDDMSNSDSEEEDETNSDDAVKTDDKDEIVDEDLGSDSCVMPQR